MSKLVFIDYEATVNASVDEAFNFFTQVERWADWSGVIQTSGYIWPQGQMQEGGFIYFIPKILPLPLTPQIIEFVPGKTIRWGLKTPVAGMVHSFEFSAVDDKTCKIRHHEEATGILATVLKPLEGQLAEFNREWADALGHYFNRIAQPA